MSIQFKRASKYDITINHTANGGTIVRIGCAEVSFTNWKDMLIAMKEYYENPEKMETQYNHSTQRDTPAPRQAAIRERRRERRYEEECCEDGCDCQQEEMPVGSGNRIANNIGAGTYGHGPDGYRR
jgi:hypothetical protein